MKYVITTNQQVCKTKSPQLYSIRNKSDKPCILVFKKQNDAVKFTKFLIENKCRFNKWPELNVSTGKTKIVNNEDEKKCHTPEFVNKFIQIVEWEEEKLDIYLAINGINVILSEHFEYNPKNLHINMDIGERNYEYDTFQVIRNLESNYK
tara:strand:+ start:6090 stop:6539 length:450 start_codon:yes stop_codon:yes gene_type:complete